MTFTRIVAGLDQSDLSHAVFRRSLTLAQACQADLHLFHALALEPLGEAGVPPIAPAMSDLGSYPTLTDPARWQQQTQAQVDQVESWLHTYAQTAINQGVSTEYSHQIGDPGYTICKLAQMWPADLIVVGRRGRSGLAEVFLGSISNHVVHHAPCAVLVVQAAESSDPKGRPDSDPST